MFSDSINAYSRVNYFYLYRDFYHRGAHTSFAPLAFDEMNTTDDRAQEGLFNVASR